MAERIDLTTPDQATPGTPMYRVAAFYFDYDGGYFYGLLVGASGERRQEIYRDGQDELGNELGDGSTIATDRMRALNRANLSTTSLHRRFLEMLTNDGRLNGSISGTPD